MRAAAQACYHKVMNKGLFDGKSKQKILYTLCLRADRFFSAREIAEINRISSASVKKLLQGFFKHGILKTAEKKGERYYQIDRRSTAFEELARLFLKQKYSQKDAVGKIVKGLGDLKFAALSGIFVGRTRGDIDLLLVGKIGAKKAERGLRELSKLAGNEINYALMEEKEFRDRLYSFDWFVKEVMDHSPVVLIDKINKRSKPSSSPRLTAVFSNFKK